MLAELIETGEGPVLVYKSSQDLSSQLGWPVNVLSVLLLHLSIIFIWFPTVCCIPAEPVTTEMFVMASIGDEESGWEQIASPKTLAHIVPLFISIVANGPKLI